MRTLPGRPRLIALAVAASALAVAVVAVPVLGQAGRQAAPAPAAPEATEKPGNGPPAEKPGKGPRAKADRPVETPVELRGRVGTRTDEEGATAYTLTVAGDVYALHAGPPWFWGDRHPLAPFVGRTVTVGGDQAEGTTDIDVRTVDGTTIREPGRPPWAGGPKAVGEDHPGWKAWKADKAGKGHGKPPWAGPKAPDANEDGGE